MYLVLRLLCATDSFGSRLHACGHVPLGEEPKEITCSLYKNGSKTQNYHQTEALSLLSTAVCFTLPVSTEVAACCMSY